MLAKLSYIANIFLLVFAIFEYMRAEKYKNLYINNSTFCSSNSGRDTNNARGDININNGI